MRLLVVLSVLFVAADVRAECAIAQWIGTASETKIPSAGSLFMFREFDPEHVDVRWIGEPGSISTHLVDDSVARIDYVGVPGSTLVVGTGYEQAARFELVDAWTKPATSPRVITYWHHESSWTCSWSDSLIVQIDQTTAAVRARWTYHGRAVDYVMPAQTDGTKAIVELGKLNCAGANIPPDQLKEGGELELVAIRFDGSEVRIRGMPRRISTRNLRSDERGLDGALAIVHPGEPEQAARVDVPSRWLGAIVLAILGLGLVISFRLAEKSASDCSRALK